MATIAATTAISSLATLTITLVIQAVTGPALERRRAWHARLDANANDLRQCLQDCMASAFYLQREFETSRVSADVLQRIQADRERSLENLDASTARLCQLTMAAVSGGPQPHGVLVIKAILAVRDIFNSSLAEDEKMTALTEILGPLYAYICGSFPRRPFRVIKALSQLIEAVNKYADGDLLLTGGDESPSAGNGKSSANLSDPVNADRAPTSSATPAVRSGSRRRHRR